MKKMIYVSIAFAAIFLSCKKDDGSSSVIPRKATRSDLYPENGYISGAINDKTADGKSFQKVFIHQLDVETASYSIDASGNYAIHLVKADKYGSVGSNDKRTEMTFVLSKDLTTVTDFSHLHTSIYVDSTASSITKFDMDGVATNSYNRMTLSNVSFDLTTGRLKADYSIQIMEKVSIFLLRVKSSMSGTIDTKLTNIHFREGDCIVLK